MHKLLYIIYQYTNYSLNKLTYIKKLILVYLYIIILIQIFIYIYEIKLLNLLLTSSNSIFFLDNSSFNAIISLLSILIFLF